MLIQRDASLRIRTRFFDLLYGTPRTQVAQMILREGQFSGPYTSDHPQADQVVIVMEGHCRLDMAGTERNPEVSEVLEPGDVALIPAGVNHRLVGVGEVPCRTVSVYSPPAYPEDSGLVNDTTNNPVEPSLPPI